MLTRLEIDGFKTFEEFEIDVGPFGVILGPNASGKSNLFDAIRLLSRLAGMDLRSAVRGLRGEPLELFRRQPGGAAGRQIFLAAEVLLDPRVHDPWGAPVEITHSRIRYEVGIERRRDDRGIDRLVVVHEEATPILARDDRWIRVGREPSSAFKQTYLKYSRRMPWLETQDTKGSPTFQIRQERRQGRTRSAQAAETTVLSSITSAEFPHLYALREEMRSWRFLQLDPASLRRPSPTTAAEEMEPDGSNLATVLARIQAETTTPEQPKGALADIAADLASLIPGVVDVTVQEDTQNREFRVDIGTREGPPFSSRVVSDGTLRILALLTLLHDPKHRGLVCFEEPENGVHPLRLKALIGRLRELVTDPASNEVDPDEPLSQILMNSHSPVVLSALQDEHGFNGEVRFCDLSTVVDPTTQDKRRRTRIRAVRSGEQGKLLQEAAAGHVSSFEVHQYLAAVDPEA